MTAKSISSACGMDAAALATLVMKTLGKAMCEDKTSNGELLEVISEIPDVSEKVKIAVALGIARNMSKLGGSS